MLVIHVSVSLVREKLERIERKFKTQNPNLRHCSGHNFQIKAIVDGQGMEPLVSAVEGVLFNIAEFR